MGTNSAGEYVGTIEFGLGKITITKSAEVINAAKAAQFGQQVSIAVAAVQSGFTVAGFIPGIGEGFDLANAGISAATGDYVGAGLSAAAAVPFLGWGASTANVSRKAIVIGENMGRVKSFANKVGAETFEGTGMKANEAWMRNALNQGYKVYDIGPDFSRRFSYFLKGERPDSIYYGMERRMSKGYSNVEKTWGSRNGRFDF